MRFPAMIALAMSVVLASPALAKERGGANTPERASWCSDKLGSCLSGALETCAFTYGANTQQGNACLEERRGQCNRSYGAGSKCQTQARTGGAAASGGAAGAVRK